MSRAEDQEEDSLNGLIIFSCYQLGHKIAGGNFGEVRMAKKLGTSSSSSTSSSSLLYAVKLEPIKTKIPLLQMENRYYRTLSTPGSIHVPSTYYFDKMGKYNCLVLELLGPSLEDLFVLCNRRFSLKTTCQIALQLLTAFEYIHSKRLAYRDVKPENFLIGRPSTGKDKTIHVIDFGLAKEYLGPPTWRHIPFREDKNLSGTPRYMSINTHLNREQSRRDDLEAVGYMLLYFLKGSLPWQGVKTVELKDKYKKIGEMKQMISVERLCEGLPEEVACFMRYARGLEFKDLPDYGFLKGLWERIMKRYNWLVDGQFDWTGKVMPEPLESLHRVEDKGSDKLKVMEKVSKDEKEKGDPQLGQDDKADKDKGLDEDAVV